MFWVSKSFRWKQNSYWKYFFLLSFSSYFLCHTLLFSLLFSISPFNSVCTLILLVSMNFHNFLIYFAPSFFLSFFLSILTSEFSFFVSSFFVCFSSLSYSRSLVIVLRFTNWQSCPNLSSSLSLSHSLSLSLSSE